MPGYAHRPANRAPGYGQALLRALLRDPRKQGTNLRLTITTVAAERPDRRQLSGFGPTCHCLRVNPEHCCDLCRCQQRLGLWGTCRHLDGLSSWTGNSILRVLRSWLHSEPAVDVLDR